MQTIGLVARNINGVVKVFDIDTNQEVTDIVAHQTAKREELARKQAAAGADGAPPPAAGAPVPGARGISSLNNTGDSGDEVCWRSLLHTHTHTLSLFLSVFCLLLSCLRFVCSRLCSQMACRLTHPRTARRPPARPPSVPPQTSRRRAL
jgi:hypothetical protein